jgi:hypothetical protein
MPKFLGMDKKKWLWIGVAGAAVVGYFLLSRGGSGGGQAGAPAEQPIQGGNAGGYAPGQTPPGFFDSGEQAASGYSQQMLQDQQSLAQSFVSPNGAWSWDPITSLWRGIKGGKSGDIGKSMTDTEARNLEPKNRGPYAHGGTSFIDKWIRPIFQASAQTYLANSSGSSGSGTPDISGEQPQYRPQSGGPNEEGGFSYTGAGIQSRRRRR